MKVTYIQWYNHLLASIQDSEVFKSLSSGSKTVDALNKQLNIEDLEEIKDRIEEQNADMAEKQEFFMSAGKADDEDELLNELDELEAEMAESELEALEIGSAPIRGGQPIANNSRAQAAEANEEDELKALERMMAL